jgi:hypothetical protein
MERLRQRPLVAEAVQRLLDVSEQPVPKRKIQKRGRPLQIPPKKRQ